MPRTASPDHPARHATGVRVAFLAALAGVACLFASLLAAVLSVGPETCGADFAEPALEIAAHADPDSCAASLPDDARFPG